MTLAFNVLVPRKGRWWAVLLVAGNLGAFSSMDLLKPPGRETFMVRGPAALRIDPSNGSLVQVVYGPVNWWDPEKSRWEYWRWSRGECSLAIHNPQPFAILADISFRLRAVDARGADVSMGGKRVWHTQLRPAEVQAGSLAGVVLAPGDTTLVFASDRPAAYPGNGDGRRLTFSLRDLVVDLKARQDVPASKP
jgi:hypothetical protein